MPDFKQGDVIRVPFPYTDRHTRQRRPALVVSHGGIGERGTLLWVIMITSAENRSWQEDIDLDNYGDAGLPAPSVIRPAKIATIEARHADAIGSIGPAYMDRVMRAIKKNLRLPG